MTIIVYHSYRRVFNQLQMVFSLLIFIPSPLISLASLFLLFLAYIFISSSLSSLLSFFILRRSTIFKQRRDQLEGLLPLFIEFTHSKKLADVIRKLQSLYGGPSTFDNPTAKVIINQSQIHLKEVLHRAKGVMLSLHLINPIKLMDSKTKEKSVSQGILQSYQQMIEMVGRLIEESQLSHSQSIIFQWRLVGKFRSLLLLNQLQVLFAELQNQLKIIQTQSFNSNSLSNPDEKLISCLKQVLLQPKEHLLQTKEDRDLFLLKIESCLLLVDQNLFKDLHKQENEQQKPTHETTYFIGHQQSQRHQNFPMQICTKEQKSTVNSFNKDKFKLDLDSLLSKRWRSMQRSRIDQEEEIKGKQKYMMEIEVKHDIELHEYEAEDMEKDGCQIQKKTKDRID